MKTYDYIVIGAGYAGIAAASLLKKQGYSVLILESHSKIGGCASNFYRSNKEFSFDVGATTISGFDSPKPLGTLLDRLELKDEARKHLKKLEIGMKVFYKDEVISRYSDQERWLEENDRVFANYRIIKLWKSIFRKEKFAWKLLNANHSLMPDSIPQWTKAAFNRNWLLNLKALCLVPSLFTPFSRILKNYKINDPDFINFINEQLLITTQSTYDKAPALSAIMGLNYPQEVYYPKGSIKNIGELILSNFQERGGELLMRQEVESIEKDDDLYLLKTNEKKSQRSNSQETSFKARSVISNSPVWSLRKLLKIDSCSKELSKYMIQFPDAWGAFTVYFAAKTKLNLGTHYLQIHAKNEIPNCKVHENSFGSIFVTLSDSQENDRAPEGWTSITISTHTNAKQWFDFKDYEEQKEKTQNAILDLLYETIPELRHCEKSFVMSGTPHSFEHYTKREYGYVGGIAHDVSKPMIFLPQQRFSKENIYLVGDSSFPGQGVAAVVYSGMSLVNKLETSVRH